MGYFEVETFAIGDGEWSLEIREDDVLVGEVIASNGTRYDEKPGTVHQVNSWGEYSTQEILKIANEFGYSFEYE